MSDSVSDSNNNNNNCSSEEKSHLSPPVAAAFEELARDNAILEYDVRTLPIGGVGENCFGLVMKATLQPLRNLPTLVAVKPPPFYVLKMAPEHPARRAHMNIANYYAREVFMYSQVFKEYKELCEECPQGAPFEVAPQMFKYSTDPPHEFLIFEDLTHKQFKQNARSNMPSYDLVVEALKSVAQLHAMSFVLQAKKPQVFKDLVGQLKDNLFNDEIPMVSVEFAKKYIHLTRTMLEKDVHESSAAKATVEQEQYLELIDYVENNFKELGMHCVRGADSAPYSVICHGDFWNNNILYEFDSNNKATSAKLIDFQMSSYSAPVLDVVRYLFVCIEKDLRQKHFKEFLHIYYETLTQHIDQFQLNSAEIYPQQVFEKQLSDYGVFGFCMAAFSIPFFISDSSEIPDLDEVSNAVQEIEPTQQPTMNSCTLNGSEQQDSDDAKEKCIELVDKYEMLNERTLPIFKRRMLGVVEDLLHYNLFRKSINI